MQKSHLFPQCVYWTTRSTHYYIRFCPNILRIILRRMVSAIQIINALSSGKSLVVFDLFAVEGGDRKSIINSLGLSPKQYNSSISALRKSGLVEKIHGKYHLTSFGEVIHAGSGSELNRVSRITGSLRRSMLFGLSFHKKNAVKPLKS